MPYRISTCDHTTNTIPDRQDKWQIHTPSDAFLYGFRGSWRERAFLLALGYAFAYWMVHTFWAVLSGTSALIWSPTNRIEIPDGWFCELSTESLIAATNISRHRGYTMEIADAHMAQYDHLGGFYSFDIATIPTRQHYHSTNQKSTS